MARQFSPLSILTSCCLVTLVAALSNVSVGLADEGDMAVVSLNDGRTLTGVVNDRTDHAELWLHSAEPSILVQTAVRWSEVRSARVGGKLFTAAAFERLAKKTKTSLPVPMVQQIATPSPFRAPGATFPVNRVQSLDVFASTGTWDRDAVSEGLQLRLKPLGPDGGILPVDGLLTVRLVGHRKGTRDIRTAPIRFGFYTNASPMSEYSPLHPYERYVELGRWTERVKASRFSLQGYVARLRFRGINPDEDLDIGLDSQVECRLDVSGQRVFYASAPVELRPYSPLRDILEIERRTRFFPGELNGQ